MNKDYSELIEEAKTGLFTLQQLGDKWHITRERVRQIYKDRTGKAFTVNLDHKRQEREIAHQARLDSFHFNCRYCEKPVTYQEGGWLWCRNCRQNKNKVRDPRIIKICQQCGKEFHPSRTAKPIFCSRECYRKSDNYHKRFIPTDFMLAKIGEYIKENGRLPLMSEYKNLGFSHATLFKRKITQTFLFKHFGLTEKRKGVYL